jgi:hypothetical protein
MALSLVSRHKATSAVAIAAWVMLVGIISSVHVHEVFGHASASTRIGLEFNAPQHDPSFNDHSYELYSICASSHRSELSNNQSREAAHQASAVWERVITRSALDMHVLPPLLNVDSFDALFWRSCLADTDYYRMVLISCPTNQSLCHR